MAIKILSDQNVTSNVIAIQAFRLGTDSLWKLRGNASSTELAFEYSTSSSLSDANIKVIFTPSGDVGIGDNVTPSQKLHVAGNIYSINSGTDGGQIRLANSGGGSNWYWAARTTGLNLGELGVADGNIFIANGGNVGIGTISPDAKLDVVGPSNGDVILKLQRNGVGSYDYFVSDAGSGAQQLFLRSNPTDSGFIFQPKNSSGTNINAMIIAPTGNVGIGTTSPSTQLHIDQASNDRAGGLYIERNGSSYGLSAFVNSGGYGVIGSNGSFTTDILTMDLSKGNVGIGTTPFPANLTPQTVLDIGNAASVWGYQNYAYLIANAYYNVGWLYKNTAPAGVLQIAGDELSFRQAGSGTADTTVTYNQPFTIKASGNVGIGVTSPSGKLEVAGGSTLGFRLSNVGDQSAYDQVRMTYTGYNSGSPTVTFMPLTTPGSGNAYTTFLFQNTNGINASSNNNANVAIDGTLQVGRSKGLGETTLIMNNYDTSLAGLNQIQNSIRMSGRYWSGSASQLVETRINSVHQESDGNGGSALTFMTQTGGSAVVEQMRIDKVGNVGIKTTPSAVLHIYNPYDVTADTDKCGIRMTRVAGGSQSWLWSLGQSGVSNNYFGLRDITHGVYKMMFKEGTGTQVMFGNPSNNGTFGASNTVLSIKGSTSGGEGILQITGLGNNATDNVGRIDFHSYNEADAMCSIRSVRGSADDIGDLEFYNNDGGSGEITLKLDHDHKALFGKVPGDGNGPHLIVNPYSYTTLMQGTSTANIFVIRNGTGLSANVGMIIFESNAGGASGQITTNSSNNTTSYNTSGSDERLKKNITDWDENVLDKFKDIQPKEFHFKNQKDSDGKLKGYIAQNEVDKFPEAYPLVEDKESGEERYLFNPSGMNVYLMKAIQELKVEIELLKNK